MHQQNSLLRINREFWQKKQPFTLQIICLASILQNKTSRKQISKHNNIFKNRIFKSQWNHYRFGVFAINSLHFYPHLRFQTALDIADLSKSVQVFCYCRCNQYSYTHKNGEHPRFSFRYSHYKQKHTYILQNNNDWRLRRNPFPN